MILHSARRSLPCIWGHAKFVRDTGGLYMQLIAANPDGTRGVSDDDRKRGWGTDDGDWAEGCGAWE